MYKRLEIDDIEWSKDDRLKIRPKKDKENHRYLEYRLVDASQNPNRDELNPFVPWPKDEVGEFDFVPLGYKQVMQLKHEDGTYAIYADRVHEYRLEYRTIEKKNFTQHIISIKGLAFVVHRCRIWLEKNGKDRFFLGKLSEGDNSYLTYNNTRYKLKQDDICQAFLPK
ncbi:MAG: hypothetical protein FWG65_07660 [Turicibacter sp.]|nr:hypothetical protein [Turicibacter sp.]